MLYFRTNLRYFRKQAKISQTALGNALGCTRSSIGAYEEGRAEPKLELLIKMAREFNTTMDLLLGYDMNSLENEAVILPNSELKVLSITLDNDGKEYIDLVPQKASAGYSSGFSDPEYLAELPRFQLPMLPDGTYRAFEITGDSMLPLKSGTIIIGEFVENIDLITNGQPYIIVSREDGIVYKRVYSKKDRPHSLFLHSDNSMYPPYSMNKFNIIEIWKARAYIGLEIPKSEISLEKLSAMVVTLQQEMTKLKS